MFYLEVGIISLMIVWTVFELVRVIAWEIQDILNNYKGKGGDEDDVCGDDW